MHEQANKPKIVIHLFNGEVAGVYHDQRIDFVVFDEEKDKAVDEDTLRASLKRIGITLSEYDLVKYGLAYAVDEALIEADFGYTGN